MEIPFKVNHKTQQKKKKSKEKRTENQFFPLRASNPLRIADNLCLFLIVCSLHKSSAWQ